MTLGSKLAGLRKSQNLTQEQLAERLNVSRQAVSKWESGAAFPETEKLIRLSELYGCSLDYLLKDDAVPTQSKDTLNALFRRLFRDRKSQKTLWGMPLWHIGKHARGVIAIGPEARGLLAIGFLARGVISIGLISAGILAFGTLSVGLIALGAFALGFAAAGAICAGVIAAGAICIGVFSLGAIAVGEFSVGALSIAKYAALGDHARGMIALGFTEASGSVLQKVGAYTAQELTGITIWLDENVPFSLAWAKMLFKLFL